MQERNINIHIEQTLDDYCNFIEPPQYAVMLKGPWGVGKTHFIKRFRELRKDKHCFIYVSLNGVANRGQINQQIFRELHPILGSKGMVAVGKALKSIFKATVKIDLDSNNNVSIDAGFPDVDIINWQKLIGDEIFIFDDLERCVIYPQEIFGYITNIVENDKCKAIVLADIRRIDEKIFNTAKEKIFGRILELQPALPEALDEFIATPIIKNDKIAYVESFLKNNKAHIEDVYNLSELKNLRVLRQAIWDFERIWHCATAEQRKNSIAMLNLMKFFLVFAMEYKSGRLITEDLRARFNAYMKWDKNEGEQPPIAKALKRYTAIELYIPVLSDDLLSDLLEKGIFDQAAISSWLKTSSHFAKLTDLPTWKQASQYYWLTDAALEELQAKIESAFDNLEYIKSGELLHIFGFRIAMSRIDAAGKSPSKTVAENRAYVDKLYKAGHLEMASSGDNWRTDHGYDGYGFVELESPEFQKSAAHLKKKRQLALVNSLPASAEALLAEMRTDPTQFFRRVSPGAHSDDTYSGVPILRHIKPKEFVATVLELEPEGQRVAIASFEGRYARNDPNGPLAVELPWVKAVKEEFDARSPDMKPLTRERISNLVGRYIAKLVRRPGKTGDIAPTT